LIESKRRAKTAYMHFGLAVTVRERSNLQCGAITLQWPERRFPAAPRAGRNARNRKIGPASDFGRHFDDADAPARESLRSGAR
jgi:hypothetical protein